MDLEGDGGVVEGGCRSWWRGWLEAVVSLGGWLGAVEGEVREGETRERREKQRRERIEDREEDVGGGGETKQKVVVK